MTIIDFPEGLGGRAKARGPLSRSAIPTAIEPWRTSRRVTGSIGFPKRDRSWLMRERGMICPPPVMPWRLSHCVTCDRLVEAVDAASVRRRCISERGVVWVDVRSSATSMAEMIASEGGVSPSPKSALIQRLLVDQAQNLVGCETERHGSDHTWHHAGIAKLADRTIDAEPGH